MFSQSNNNRQVRTGEKVLYWTPLNATVQRATIKFISHNYTTLSYIKENYFFKKPEFKPGSYLSHQYLGS